MSPPRLRPLVVASILGGLVGFGTCALGYTYDTWQFWAFAVPVSFVAGWLA